MSLFGTLMSKIFPASHPSVQNQNTAQNTQPAAAGAQQQQQPATQAGAANSGVQQPQMSPSGGQANTAQQVDVEGILDDMAQKNPQKLDWRHSIVDMMKLLGMDSSLSARKQLAQELHYNGDTNDSAAMNIWLHKQVMTKLAENGGKVPQDLVRH